MKKGKLLGLIVIATGLLTGCVDHMPEMTEEQSALIAEYAADMLLKYSPNYIYKIADEEIFAEEIVEMVAEEVTEEITEDATEEQKEETVEVIEVETTSTVEEKAEAASDVTDAREIDFAETLAMDDVEIRYENMEICSAYPKGDVGTGFSVSAAEGNSLIIVHMLIENTSEAVITCDLFEKDLDASIKINGGNYKKASNTLLVNDFITYMEEIPVGESREAVIVVQVNEITEEEMESCVLRMATKNGSVTAKLK